MAKILRQAKKIRKRRTESLADNVIKHHSVTHHKEVRPLYVLNQIQEVLSSQNLLQWCVNNYNLCLTSKRNSIETKPMVAKYDHKELRLPHHNLNIYNLYLHMYINEPSV